MNKLSTAQTAPRLLPITETDQADSSYHHASLRLSRQDILWLDGLAAMYSSSRSAVARLVIAEARRISEKSISRAPREDA